MASTAMDGLYSGARDSDGNTGSSSIGTQLPFTVLTDLTSCQINGVAASDPAKYPPPTTSSSDLDQGQLNTRLVTGAISAG